MPEGSLSNNSQWGGIVAVPREAPPKNVAYRPLFFQKRFHLDLGLFEDRTERALRHISRMIGDGGVAVCRRIALDFMATRSLANKLKTQFLETFDDFPIAKTGEPPHQALTTSG